jgi:hypothetical protein
MKTLIATLALASILATSAVAKTEKTRATHVDQNAIYHSYSLGNQSMPNPDRDPFGPNRPLSGD